MEISKTILAGLSMAFLGVVGRAVNLLETESAIALFTAGVALIGGKYYLGNGGNSKGGQGK